MNQVAEIYQRLIERTTELIFDQDLSQTRIILGMSEFFWAFACWYPGDTFDRPIYSTLKGIAPEGVWGLIFFVSALLQVSVVAFSWHTRSYGRLFAFANFMLWTFVIVSIFTSTTPPPVAVSGELALIIAAFWSWARPLILFKFDQRSFRDTQGSFGDTQILNAKSCT